MLGNPRGSIRASLISTWTLIAAVAVVLPLGASEWPSYRGPEGSGSAPEGAELDFGEGLGLGVAWKTELGSGYSAVSIADGRAVTMVETDGSTWMVALDASTGAELWREKVGPPYKGHDGSHDGPIATPLLADGRVFALGPWGELLAVDAISGQELWRTHLVEDHGGSKPHYGYTLSPVMSAGVLVIGANLGEAGTVAGFDPVTGERVWAVGEGPVAYQSVLPIDVGGREQLLVAGSRKLYGIDPERGALLWEWEHEGGGAIGAESMNPVPLGDGRFFLNHKDDASTVVQIGPGVDGGVTLDTLWENRSIRGTYNVPVYHEGYIYGYSSRFLTCVDASTGEPVWKSRQPGDGFVSLVDGHLVIVTKAGGVHVAEATPEDYRELGAVPVLSSHAWTAPSFADGRIYARGFAEVAAIEVSAGRTAGSGQVQERLAADSAGFAAFLGELEGAEDKAAAIDEYLASVPSFPIIEGNTVHFVYRGEGNDVAIEADVIGDRYEEPLTRVEDTDLFHRSYEVAPDSRISYRFIRDFEQPFADPRNEESGLREVSTGGPGEYSWVGMPAWEAPGFFGEPDGERGRIERIQLSSEEFEEDRNVDVYLPAGYDGNDERYPVAYVHSGDRALDFGDASTALDNLLGQSVEPMIVVFIHNFEDGASSEAFGPPRDKYSDSVATELVPLIDEKFKTSRLAEDRASVGAGWGGNLALHTAFRHPDVFGTLSTQSIYWLTRHEDQFRAMVDEAGVLPLKVTIERGLYDRRAEHEGWDMRRANDELAEFLEAKGYDVTTRVVQDGWGWPAWRNQADDVYGSLFR